MGRCRARMNFWCGTISSGPHGPNTLPRCCGRAQQEAVLILAEVIRHFRLEFPAGRRRPEVVARLTLRPRDGFALVLRPR